MLTRKEKIRIFRPNVELKELERREKKFVGLARKECSKQAESLRLQFDMGVRPENLILDTKYVINISNYAADMLIDTFAMGILAIQHEIHEAINIFNGKPAIFNTDYNAIFTAAREDELPGFAEFYPEAGVDWYQNYGLKLAGIQQQAALESAKKAVMAGVEQGLTHKNVMGLLAQQFEDFSSNRLENIARTETAKIYEQARWREMDGEERVVGYEVAAIMDGRTTEICRSRDGKKIRKEDIEGWLPPYHFSCRTILLPLLDFEEIPDSDYVDSGSGIQPMDGFGSTSMRIPDVKDRDARSLIRRAEKKLI